MADLEMADDNNDNDTTTIGSEILTIAEAAKRLGKSERTIFRLVQVGTLQGVKVDGKTCIQMAGYNRVVPIPAKSAKDKDYTSKPVSQANDMTQQRNDTPSDNSNIAQNSNDTVSEKLVDALKETIHILQEQILNRDQEIQRLWERIPPTLPAPESYNQQRGGAVEPVNNTPTPSASNDIWAYIVAGVLIVITALVIYALRP